MLFVIQMREMLIMVSEGANCCPSVSIATSNLRLQDNMHAYTHIHINNDCIIHVIILVFIPKGFPEQSLLKYI